jgi:hypothetical protein
MFAGGAAHPSSIAVRNKLRRFVGGDGANQRPAFVADQIRRSVFEFDHYPTAATVAALGQWKVRQG